MKPLLKITPNKAKNEGHFSVGRVYIEFKTYDNFLLPKYNVCLIYLPIFVYLTDSTESDIYIYGDDLNICDRHWQFFFLTCCLANC